MSKKKSKKKENKKKKKKQENKAKKTTSKGREKPEKSFSKKSDKKTKKQEKVVYARAKYIKGSAQKARLVIDLVRGKNALESMHKLDFINKRAAKPIKKTIKSAVANATHNFEMDKKRLKIVKAQVNEAPTFKRGRAGSRGRYKKILKRNCHIIIGVSEK